MPGASQYNQRLDSIVGFCGPKGPDHQCDCNSYNIVIGDGEDAYEIIANAWETQQLAGHLRLMVVNPLHKQLPSLSVMAHATCNRFDAAWIKRDWARTRALAEEHISGLPRVREAREVGCLQRPVVDAGGGSRFPRFREA